MALLDKEFTKHKAQFVLQCLLATISILAALIILERISSHAVIAALGATSFIVFAIPKSESSKPRPVIGGYLIGVAVGTICHWPAHLVATGNPALDKYAALACTAVAVGLAIFLMTITNTEHPPAVGVALGLTMGQWHVQAVLAILVGVVFLCVVKWLLRSWLRNLA